MTAVRASRHRGLCSRSSRTIQPTSAWGAVSPALVATPFPSAPPATRSCAAVRQCVRRRISRTSRTTTSTSSMTHRSQARRSRPGRPTAPSPPRTCRRSTTRMSAASPVSTSSGWTALSKRPTDLVDGDRRQRPLVARPLRSRSFNSPPPTPGATVERTPQSRQAAKLLSGHARRSRESGGDTTLASQPGGRHAGIESAAADPSLRRRSDATTTRA